MDKVATVDDVIEAPLVEIAGVRLVALEPKPIHWLAPWPSSERAMSASLEASCALPFPKPGEFFESGGITLAWAGRSAALLMGIAPSAELSEHGASIDVSDGWVGFALFGDGRADVMARLCSVDLRSSRNPNRTALRTEVGHVPALILLHQDSLEIWISRSFAVTVYDDLLHAAKAIAARRELAQRHAY